MSKLFVQILFINFILGCDGYYHVKKDINYVEPITSECIKKSIGLVFSDVNLKIKNETDSSANIELSWKDKDHRILRGSLIYSKTSEQNTIQIEARGVTAWFPEIKNRKEKAENEVDRLVEDLKIRCHLKVKSVKESSNELSHD